MHIKQIVSQHRRDFTAIFECEHCGHTYSGPGYDDEYFHNAVLPWRPCNKCGKVAEDDSKIRKPKYDEGVQV